MQQRAGSRGEAAKAMSASRNAPSPDAPRAPRPRREPRVPPKVLRLVVKPLLWVLCLTPAALLAQDAFTGGLGVNPIEEVTHRTGRWALTLLLATLAVTPVRRLTGWNQAVQLRRPLGLFAFAYAVLHFLTYIVLDQFFAWDAIIEDIAERPYITAGFAAFLLLIPLAATSTRAAIRRLGRNWGRLHRLVYVAAGLGVLHFLWLVKAPAIGRPLRYAAVLALLLGLRIVLRLRRRPARARARAAG
ncbi:MAG TPA: protein-methionine-sulfoxide reductase heme-binding subunit MsrQ [Longimicrobiales bacterium]